MSLLDDPVFRFIVVPLMIVVFIHFIRCMHTAKENRRIKRNLDFFLHDIGDEMKIVSISVHKPEDTIHVTVTTEDSVGKQTEHIHEILYEKGMLFDIKQHIFDQVLFSPDSSEFTTISRNPKLINCFPLKLNNV